MGLVQSKSTSQAAGATLPLTFNLMPEIKSTIIAVGSSSVVADTLAISDGVNSYTALAAINNAGSTLRSRLFYFINLVTPASTLTLSGLTGKSSLAIHEFSGITSFDVAANANGISNAQDSSAATTTKAPELLFGYSSMSFVGIMSSLTTATPWNTAETLIDAINLISVLTAWQDVLTTGAFNFTSADTLGKSSSQDWVSQIAGFAEASSSMSHQQLRKYRQE